MLKEMISFIFEDYLFEKEVMKELTSSDMLCKYKDEKAAKELIDKKVMIMKAMHIDIRKYKFYMTEDYIIDHKAELVWRLHIEENDK